MMLGDRKSPQSSIKDMPGSCNPALEGHKCSIVHPNARHLMHEHQSTFKGVIDFFIHGISDTFATNLLPSGTQVVVPYLITAGQLFKGSFIDNIYGIIGSPGLVVNIA